ncbi:MAG: hypothetical protein KGJ12_06930, partial [Gammaproteobacteria bacterium]|nr:hypothetical protein [Gammaproteobacteria bacterium]
MNAVALQHSTDIENIIPKDDVVTERYNHIITRFDPEFGIVWCYWNPQPRACFTPELIREIYKFQKAMEVKIKNNIKYNGSSPIEYIVFTSNIPGVYSFGGDLDIFVKAIRDNDRETLKSYIKSCFDILYWPISHNLP